RTRFFAFAEASGAGFDLSRPVAIRTMTAIITAATRRLNHTPSRLTPIRAPKKAPTDAAAASVADKRKSEKPFDRNDATAAIDCEMMAMRFVPFDTGPGNPMNTMTGTV